MVQNEALPRGVRRTLHDCAREGGRVLLGYFGRITNPRRKGGTSSIVCDADLAAEKCVVDIIRSRFPDHNVIAEESGYRQTNSPYTWVIDPLDGTSNFVAGLPWFGVQLGLLRDGIPVAGIMHLPVAKATYFAELGHGTTRNRQPVRVHSATDTHDVLCAFGFDPDIQARSRKESLEVLLRVSRGVRNTRATNSLVDFCYTADGRLGGCVNLCTKIWDIVPVSIILPEAGGTFSDLQGRPIHFDLTKARFDRTYVILGAPRQLHPKFVHLLAG